MSPYFSASIADEYKRVDFVDSRDIHPPLPDESCVTAFEPGIPEMPEEYPDGEWLFGLVVIVVTVAAGVIAHWQP